MDNKIIQIMPAPESLYAVYYNEKKEIISKILCLGLTDGGDILLLDIDEYGIVSEATDAVNFKNIAWRGRSIPMD